MERSEIKLGEIIRLDTDMWDDIGLYQIKEFSFVPNSTAVHLLLEDINTQKLSSKVVAYHQIYRGT